MKDINLFLNNVSYAIIKMINILILVLYLKYTGVVNLAEEPCVKNVYIIRNIEGGTLKEKNKKWVMQNHSIIIELLQLI